MKFLTLISVIAATMEEQATNDSIATSFLIRAREKGVELLTKLKNLKDMICAKFKGENKEEDKNDDLLHSDDMKKLTEFLNQMRERIKEQKIHNEEKKQEEEAFATKEQTEESKESKEDVL